MLLRWLLLGVAVWLLLAWVRGRGRKPSANEPKPAQKAAPSAQADAVVVMVCCHHCGVHLPQEDALPGVDGVGAAVHFCGVAHRDASAGRGSAP